MGATGDRLRQCFPAVRFFVRSESQGEVRAAGVVHCHERIKPTSDAVAAVHVSFILQSQLVALTGSYAVAGVSWPLA